MQDAGNNDRPGPPPSVLQRHQLATYFGLAFAISWATWLGLILGSLHIRPQQDRTSPAGRPDQVS